MTVAFANHIVAFLKAKDVKVQKRFSYRSMTYEEQVAWIVEYGKDYIKETFPGLGDNQYPLDLIQMLTSGNPDALVMAEVARNGGYDPCDSGDEFVEILQSLPECPDWS